MNNRKIKLGLPKGSLNMITRGDTESLLLDAGYGIIGYTPGNERSDQLRIANDAEIEPYLVRPQNAPGDLNRELLDIAIIGEDWVQEESSVTRPLTRLADLEYGQVGVVAATAKDNEAKTLTDFFLSKKGAKGPIVAYTEYTKLTRDCFLENSGYQQVFGNKTPMIEIRGFRNGENELVQVIYSEGATEDYIKRGADLIVDNTRTGGSLERAGAKILEDLMTSSAGLYARPKLQEDAWKWEKAIEIRDKLFGVAVARKYDDVKFNIEPDKLGSVTKYILKEGLARKAPTTSSLIGLEGLIVGYAINIVVPKARWPEVSTVLKRDYGATAIVRSDLKQLIL